MWDPTADAAAISAMLREKSSTPVDPSPIIKTALPFYGVKLADLRRIASGWHRDHRGVAPGNVAALADALWSASIREEMVVAALLHGHDARSRSVFGLRRVDRWARSIDNWETADALGAWLAARATADDPERRYPVLETLAGRRNPWARRISLVGCIGTARAPQAATWWPRVTGIVLRLAADRAAGIPKAISWVLREHTRRTPGPVEAFLDEHGDDLPAIAVRETRNKLRTGLKRG
jgi:3-methyladenine DNA glycosylase AlkD